MSWQTDMTTIVRVWINDLDASPTYSDSRIQQVITVAAQNVIREVNFVQNYTIDISSTGITPDPTAQDTKDDDFVALTSLKSACILDQSTFRTKAVNEGIKTTLASASLSVQGNLRGYHTLLQVGPCAIYDQLRTEFEVGNPSTCQAILSPFVGNKFDPRNTSSHLGGFYRNSYYIDKFYS